MGVSTERCPERASHAPKSRRTVDSADNRAEVREFLISRRAKVTPQQAGWRTSAPAACPACAAARSPPWPGQRRVLLQARTGRDRRGLRIRSGRLARALQLDDAERAHLFHLAHAADGTSADMRPRRRNSYLARKDG
jgi:hypothetical protein